MSILHKVTAYLKHKFRNQHQDSTQFHFVVFPILYWLGDKLTNSAILSMSKK